jgi:hypothetical protein
MIIGGHLSFIHKNAPQWWESMRSCLIGYNGNVLSFPTWRNGPFQEITDIPPPPPRPAPAVLYIFPIVAKHRFPSDHTGPEWFSTHRRTIHPLDAWTCCGWTWTSPVPSPPVLAHRHWLTNRQTCWINILDLRYMDTHNLVCTKLPLKHNVYKNNFGVKAKTNLWLS